MTIAGVKMGKPEMMLMGIIIILLVAITTVIVWVPVSRMFMPEPPDKSTREAVSLKLIGDAGMTVRYEKDGTPTLIVDPFPEEEEAQR